MIYTVGTRGSKLALAQTNRTLEQIRQKHPEVDFKLKIIKTEGDKEHGKPLFSIDAKGIFEREIDQEVASGEIDFAIHSLKDVPIVEHTTGTVLAAVPKRDSPCDVFISKNNVRLEDLSKGSVVGTGSLRRLAEIKYVRPDLVVEPIRGNVDTRISKVQNGELAGIIIAEAGLERMNIASQMSQRLSLDLFPSAAGQGSIALMVKEGNTDLLKLLQSVEDKVTRAEVTAERSLVLKLAGGCRVPIGAVSQVVGDTLTILGSIYSLNECKKIFASAKGLLSQARELGFKVGEELIVQGAKDFEKEWREKYGAW
ncbi:MAG: hydroxymethylbilane synthase [Nitrososphaerota archaeon]|jgi:hydroxymethylbilane synthase|uniref:hydroxymethylbilane synthase n=1 Tax=Candidatus Bathycorpusculum sp. TaxID=2994959 RepID=UPI002816E827|nr:hydroxymethylbilane synthase [Candidatus Termiticorpusculum sp.]MCL2257028.1 hydroxymethylbilane synthase [Candidatus Termiticorpusculum sp.]MCL2292847.1 hydroxymethylbilane synthase [Candidatus Termiticorpusculum sp.]MDR0460376.1 hydroxymethylbilane synthase [Nitrososphaerota archaeon]